MRLMRLLTSCTSGESIERIMQTIGVEVLSQLMRPVTVHHTDVHPAEDLTVVLTLLLERFKCGEKCPAVLQATIERAVVMQDRHVTTPDNGRNLLAPTLLKIAWLLYSPLRRRRRTTQEVRISLLKVENAILST